MGNQPLISVIVPVYRAEQYIDKCVLSLVEQTYQNLEILLVDDGSPDRSGAMCDAWAEKDSRVKVIHKKNGGTGTARNLALDICKGDYISFVDNDDYISQDMYQSMVELMQDDVDLVECGFQRVYDDNGLFETGNPEAKTYSAKEAMLMHIQDGLFRQVIWNKLYRREIIGDARFPAGITMDDEFFTYKAIGRCRRLVHTDKVCYAYRQQPESITHSPYSMKRLTGLQAKQERLAYLKENMPELAREAEDNLYYTCMYAMQMCMLAFSGEELSRAKDVIWGVLNQITPPSVKRNCGMKEKIWIVLARISFEGTCALRNFLFERG